MIYIEILSENITAELFKVVTEIEADFERIAYNGHTDALAAVYDDSNLSLTDLNQSALLMYKDHIVYILNRLGIQLLDVDQRTIVTMGQLLTAAVQLELEDYPDDFEYVPTDEDDTTTIEILLAGLLEQPAMTFLGMVRSVNPLLLTFLESDRSVNELPVTLINISRDRFKRAHMPKVAPLTSDAIRTLGSMYYDAATMLTVIQDGLSELLYKLDYDAVASEIRMLILGSSTPTPDLLSQALTLAGLATNESRELITVTAKLNRYDWN